MVKLSKQFQVKFRVFLKPDKIYLRLEGDFQANVPLKYQGFFFAPV